MRRIAIPLCACFLLVLTTQAQNFGMRMHVIDIGQGDAILLEFKHHAVLVDAGGEDTKDAGRYKGYLIKYLDAFFARRSDLNDTLYGLLLSHPHPDHAKYLVPVLTKYKVLTFLEGGGTTSNVKSFLPPARKLVAQKDISRLVLLNTALSSASLQAWTDAIKQGSGATVRFLSGRRFCSNPNNDSLVMRVEYGQKSFLLTGDSEVEDEDPNNCGGLIAYLLSRPNLAALLDVDVYKVGHHASYNGTNEQFLQKISPQFAVISAGKYEDRSPDDYHAFQYGHPRGSKTKPTRDAFLKIVKATAGTRPTTQIYYLDRANDTSKNKFTLSKAVYCTCWDDNVIFEVNSAGNDIIVDTLASH